MSRILLWGMVALIIANVIHYWDNEAVFGWLSALIGWLYILFAEEFVHGNSG